MPTGTDQDDGVSEAAAADISVKNDVDMRAKRRYDTHRALELLEEYHSRLVRDEDQQLRIAIEQVIRIFKTCLFKTLLDIQAFYEITLQNEDKSLQEKTSETLEVASRWEKHSSIKYQQNASVSVKPKQEQLLPRLSSAGLSNMSESAVNQSVENSSFVAQSSSLSSCLNPEVHCQTGYNGQMPTTNQGGILDVKQRGEQIKDDGFWRYEEIILDRGHRGFGFSISGGTDYCHFAGDTGIYVTKILESKAAAIDGRLRTNDLIISVNGVSMVSITHALAVDILRKAGDRVRLVVKRRAEQRVMVELRKGPNGLGFSICGGVGNENVPGDDGIFVRDIVGGGVADLDGRLGNGDRLLEVNGFRLENITHEAAVAAVKASGDFVRLLIVKQLPLSVLSSEDSFSKQLLSSPSAPTSEAACSRSEESLSVTPNSRQVSVTAEAIESPVSVARCQEIFQCSESVVSVDAAFSRSPRTVVLRKNESGLGFNIVGGEAGTGIFISFIQGGGVADLSGDLRLGDQILSVNGVNFSSISHEEAASILRRSNSLVNMTVAYNPEEYSCFEAKIFEFTQQLLTSNSGNIKMTEKKTLHVRALFDYDPLKDSDLPGRGLSFRYGDILHVTNASDEEWWQAYRLVPRADTGFGIIPSKNRVERKERSRLRSVTFLNADSDGRLKSQTFPREVKKKPLFARKLSLTKSREKNEPQPVSTSNENVSEESIPPSYEPVVQQDLQYPRPLIIMGPQKDLINDGLISEYPEQFGTCIPHTTRPIREGEIDGRDYHFVVSREQMERDIESNQFIEAGQYNGNLYGTHLKSVIGVAQQGKHCVLDVSMKAIINLESANLYPIAVLIKALAPQVIMNWNKQISEDEARKSYECSLKLEKEFGEHFTAIVSGSNLEEIYETVKDVVFDNSGLVVWVSAAKRDCC